MVNLILLICDFIDMLLHVVKLIFYLYLLLVIVAYLRSVLLEGGTKEEFPIAYAAAPSHPAQSLNLAKCQVLHSLYISKLVGEDA